MTLLEMYHIINEALKGREEYNITLATFEAGGITFHDLKLVEVDDGADTILLLGPKESEEK